MNCPRCSVPQLIERDRDGITVDICPDCRGVWLDRGELEKLVQRAVAEIEAAEARWPTSSRPPLPMTGDALERREGDPDPARDRDRGGDYDREARDRSRNTDDYRGDRDRSKGPYRDGDRDRSLDRDRYGARDRYDREGYRRYHDDDDDDDHRRGRKKGWLERIGEVFD